MNSWDDKNDPKCKKKDLIILNNRKTEELSQMQQICRTL